ncbi:hypothetical protein J6TS7_17370 [Paenibacillus dendritiformis]|nr:hypothetical protein J6TS7_17370 [Paenibacillus dendritiformis]
MDNALGNSTIGDFFIFVHEYSSISYKYRDLWGRNFRKKIDATLVPFWALFCRFHAGMMKRCPICDTMKE